MTAEHINCVGDAYGIKKEEREQKNPHRLYSPFMKSSNLQNQMNVCGCDYELQEVAMAGTTIQGRKRFRIRNRKEVGEAAVERA